MSDTDKRPELDSIEVRNRRWKSNGDLVNTRNFLKMIGYVLSAVFTAIGYGWAYGNLSSLTFAIGCGLGGLGVLLIQNSKKDLTSKNGETS